jgi:F-type H+-transporting ATPase subunit gamma
VKAPQKITMAMQMVAAAKLRRAQTAAEAARPYAERMDAILANIASKVAGQAGAPALLGGTGKDDVHLLLVCTAERGLCGAFNSSIARLARERANALLAAGKTVKIICVGRKGYDILRRTFAKNIIDVIDLRTVRTLGYENAQEIAQIPTAQQIIPPQLPEVKAEAAGTNTPVYEYEPEEDEILAELLPTNLATQVFRALLENAASEQGARMSAMDSATRNAGDMIRKQTITYNRTRQAMITKELIEIISGAEAL